MPHAIIEYSANVLAYVKPADITRTVHQMMTQSGLFNAGDIKSRCYVVEDYLVGEKGEDGSFVHVQVSLLEGRTSEQKQALSGAIFEALKTLLAQVDQISVDIRDMVRDTYRK